MQFPPTANLLSNNDIVGGIFNAIVFTGSGYTLAGNGLALSATGAAISNNAPNNTPNTINFNAVLNGSIIQVNPAATLNIGGVLSNPMVYLGAGITVNGGGMLALSGIRSRSREHSTRRTECNCLGGGA